MRTHPRSIGLLAVPLLILVLLLTVPLGAAAERHTAAAPQQKPQSAADHNATSKGKPATSTDPSTVTNDDILRALAQNDPPETIIARIRRNRSNFNNLDELFAGIRKYGTYAPDAALSQLVQEITASKWRNGEPASTADPREASPVIGPASAPQQGQASGAGRVQPQPLVASPSASGPTQSQDRAGSASSHRQQIPVETPSDQHTLKPAALHQSEANQKTPQPAGASAAGSAPKGYDLQYAPDVVRFDDTEVQTKSSSSFSVTNKGTLGITLGMPMFCDADGENCAQESGNFSLGDGADKCKSPLASGDHCDFNVFFAPRRAGNFLAKIKFDAKDNNGSSHPLMIPVVGSGTVANIAHVVAEGTSQEHPSFRSVVGLDISGATSSDTQQKAFLDFALNVPIGHRGYVGCFDTTTGKKVRSAGTKEEPGRLLSREGCKGRDQEWFEQRSDPLNRRLWFFFNPRITSLPQQPIALSNLNVQGFTDLFSNKKTELVQGVDVQGGAEFLLIKPRSGIRFFSSYRNTEARIGVALVAGLGITTPFSGTSDNPTVFALAANSSLRHQFQESDPTCTPTPAIPCKLVDIPQSFTNIAFVNQERSRFFRKYYAGLRLKTYHFSPLVENKYECDPGYHGPCEGLLNAYPGVIDLTVGQDEQITGGRLSRWLFRLDAVYPLPFVPGLHIFGSVYSAFQKNRLSEPLFLPATSTTPISDPSVFIVNVPQRDRDVYRLGIGVDLLQVIKKYKEVGKPNQSMSPSAGTTEKRVTEATGADNTAVTKGEREAAGDHDKKNPQKDNPN